MNMPPPPQPPSPSPSPSSAAPMLAHQRARFAQIARRFEPDLMRTALRLCRGRHSWAEDLVQETLIRAYEAYLAGRYVERPSGGAPGSGADAGAKPWLTRILTNLFINDYRHEQRWESGASVDEITSGGEAGPSQTHAPAADTPGARLLAHTLDEDLERALNSLSDPLRVCVILVDIDGLEYEEAAQALQIPVGTVRSRLARARMKLHDLLQEFARKRGFLR